MRNSTNSSSVQLGGKGYRHKKSCKCALCKRGGRKHRKGGENTTDIEMGPIEEESMKDLEITEPVSNNYTSDAEDKVGGKRRTRRRKQRKTRHRKSRRH